jgi:hypothetical protein
MDNAPLVAVAAEIGRKVRLAAGRVSLQKKGLFARYSALAALGGHMAKSTIPAK